MWLSVRGTCNVLLVLVVQETLWRNIGRDVIHLDARASRVSLAHPSTHRLVDAEGGVVVGGLLLILL